MNITTLPTLNAQPLRNKPSFGNTCDCNSCCPECKIVAPSSNEIDSFQKTVGKDKDLQNSLIKLACALLAIAGVKSIKPSEA